MVVRIGDSGLGLELADALERDLSALEVVVVLEGHVARGEVVVGRTVALLEVGELLTHGHLALKHAAEVPSREEAIVRKGVVHRVRLIIVEVLEVRGIGVTKIERHEGVTIINSIKLAAFHELLNIVLNNWSLVNGCSLGSGGVNANAVTESKDVLETLVLKSIWVNVNNTLTVCNL